MFSFLSNIALNIWISATLIAVTIWLHTRCTRRRAAEYTFSYTSSESSVQRSIKLNGNGYKKQRGNHIQAQRYKIKQRAEPRAPLPWKKIFKRLAQTIVIGGIITAIAYGWWAWRQKNHLPITKVQVVTTYAHIEPQTLQKIIGAHLNGNFFNVDAAGLRQDLLEIPWISEVFIRRKWPDTIVVNISEQQPIAQWKNVALLNTHGILFTPPKNTFPIGLPLLLGNEEDVHEVVINFQKMQQMLATLNLRIIQLDLNEQRNWHMLLRKNNQNNNRNDTNDNSEKNNYSDNSNASSHNNNDTANTNNVDKNNANISMFLGNEDVIAKIQTFIIAYPKIIATNPSKEIETVDLRYKNGVAIKWTNSH